MAQWEGHDKNEFGMPVGCRFVPTDEELLRNYLFRWVHGLLVSSPLLEEKDVYGAEPWVLLGDRPEAYFFSTKVPLRPGSKRTKRAAGTGSWVLYSKETPVTSVRDGREGVIGYKYCLSYRYGGNKNSGWTMHEFQLLGNEFQSRVLCRIKVNPNSASTDRKRKGMASSSSSSSLMETSEQQWFPVLCPGPLVAADDGLIRGSIGKKRRLEVEPTPESSSFLATVDHQQESFPASLASHNAFSSLASSEEYYRFSQEQEALATPWVDEHHQQQFSSNPCDGLAAWGGSSAMIEARFSEEEALFLFSDALITIDPQPASLVDGSMMPAQTIAQPGAAEASVAIVPAADKSIPSDSPKDEAPPVHSTENVGKPTLPSASILGEFSVHLLEEEGGGEVDLMFHIDEIMMAEELEALCQEKQQEKEESLLFDEHHHLHKQTSSNPSDDSASWRGLEALVSEDDFRFLCSNEFIIVDPQPRSSVDCGMMPVQPMDRTAAVEASMAIVPVADRSNSSDSAQDKEPPSHSTKNADESALPPLGICGEAPVVLGEEEDEFKLTMEEAYCHQLLQQHEEQTLVLDGLWDY